MIADCAIVRQAGIRINATLRIAASRPAANAEKRVID
jgi:hypothetical protein